MKFLLKALFVVSLSLILLGALLDSLTLNLIGSSPSEGGSSPTSTSMPQTAVDPRFHGPEHPTYGKNYYQVYNEVVFELRQKGYPEEHIRLACIAIEGSKCGYCNGYGSRGHYRCEPCRGDGVIDN